MQFFDSINSEFKDLIIPLPFSIYHKTAGPGNHHVPGYEHYRLYYAAEFSVSA